MLAMSETDGAEERDSPHWVELALATMAAVSMLAFAWSGFQSAEWVRERFAMSDASAALSESSLEIAAEADRLEERDTIMYIEWLVASNAGDDESAETIFELFRPELQSHFGMDDAAEQAPPPFDTPEYDVAAMRLEAASLDSQAREAAVRSREASQNAARYSALGVLFVTVLAGAGIASRFNDRRLRIGLLIVGSSLFAAGMVFVLLSPVNLSAP